MRSPASCLPAPTPPAGHPHRPQAQRAAGRQQGGAAPVGRLAAAAGAGGAGGRAAGAVSFQILAVALPCSSLRGLACTHATSPTLAAPPAHPTSPHRCAATARTGAVGHLPPRLHQPAALPAHPGRRLRAGGPGGGGPPAARAAGPVGRHLSMDRHSALHAAARVAAGGQLHGALLLASVSLLLASASPLGSGSS